MTVGTDWDIVGPVTKALLRKRFRAKTDDGSVWISVEEMIEKFAALDAELERKHEALSRTRRFFAAYARGEVEPT